MKNMTKLINERKVIATLTTNDTNVALNVASALYEGGVSAIEVTLRTPTALDSIKAIRKEIPDMLVIAGTVIKKEQVKQVIDVDAHFGIAPATSPKIIEEAKKEGLFFVPGIMTPSDIERALEYDCTLLKYFPAGTAGGMKHLEYMSAPYNHLGVSFIPLGGVNASNYLEFLAHPLITAVGGSWLATPAQIEAKDYLAIKKQAMCIAKRGL